MVRKRDMVFNDMASELGENVKNGPIQGMLLEHDLGRRFVGYWGKPPYANMRMGTWIQRWISSPMPSAMPPYCRIILPRRTMCCINSLRPI